jgi:hypothetical protein
MIYLNNPGTTGGGGSITTSGSMMGVIMGTGGILQAVMSTGQPGQYLKVIGANTYDWATPAGGAHDAVTIGTANGLAVDANQVLSLTTATVAAAGALDPVDWATFSSRMATVTTGAVSATAPITFTAARQILGGAATVAITTGVLTATPPLNTTTVWSLLGAGNTLSLTTGILNATGPLSTSGLIVVPGSAGSITMTTGLLTPTAPITTSGTTVIVGTGRTISITTGVLNATGPLSTSGLIVVPGAAGTISMTTGLLTPVAPLTTSGTAVIVGTGRTISITTGVLTANPPLTTASVFSILGASNTIGITTGILTISAPMVTSGQFTIPTGAATVSMQTATPSTNGYIISGDYNKFDRRTKSFVVYAPPGSATYTIWKTPTACTISSANALVVGAGSSVTGQLQEADGNGASGVTITTSCEIVAAANTGLVISNSGIDANDYILWVTTATSGTPTSLTVSFAYVEA